MNPVFIYRGALAQLRTTEQKGRELNAPCIEAPRSACQTSTPSRARWGACSVGCLTGLGKIRGFRCSPQSKLRRFDFLFDYIIFPNFEIESNSVRYGKNLRFCAGIEHLRFLYVFDRDTQKLAVCLYRLLFNCFPWNFGTCKIGRHKFRISRFYQGFPKFCTEAEYHSFITVFS
jgi:hypothetical protein